MNPPQNILDSDIARWQAISILLCNDKWLLDFIFAPDRSRLNSDPKVLIGESRSFSGSQQLLLRVALHIWTSDSGLSVNLWDITHSLDDLRFDSFSMCLHSLRS